MIEASCDQPVDVPLGHRRDLGDVEAPECLPERVPLPEHDRPAQPDLEHAQGERLEHRGLVVGAGTPDLVVVAAEGGIAGAGPGAAWLPVVPDDHVAAHPTSSRRGCARAHRSTDPLDTIERYFAAGAPSAPGGVLTPPLET